MDKRFEEGALPCPRCHLFDRGHLDLIISISVIILCRRWSRSRHGAGIDLAVNEHIGDDRPRNPLLLFDETERSFLNAIDW